MKRGEAYDFICPGRQIWKDGGVSVAPNGDASEWYRAYMSLYSNLKRVPSMPTLALIGRTTSSEQDSFQIGYVLKEHTIKNSGELVCFGNDVPGFYFNNSGSLILLVTRRH
jgi:hypothetical protein